MNELVWGHGESEDVENWSGAYASRDEAIAAAIPLARDEERDYVWVNSGHKLDPGAMLSGHIDADRLLEDYVDSEPEELMCFDDPVLELKPGAQDALMKVIAAWAAVYVSAGDAWIADGTPEKVSV